MKKKKAPKRRAPAPRTKPAAKAKVRRASKRSLRDAVLDTYASLFGPAAATDELGDASSMLTWSWGTLRVVATEGFLAAGAPAGCEAIAYMRYRHDAFARLLPAIASYREELAPLDTVAFADAIEDTAFDSAVFAPPLQPALEGHTGAIEARLTGSIPLADSGGKMRFALHVVPITSAERAFAVREGSDALLAKLGTSGGILFDPIRACAISPGESMAKRERGRMAILARESARIVRSLARYSRLSELLAPEIILDGERSIARETLALLEHAGWDRRELPDELVPLADSLAPR